ncbi:MAG: RiPP maturation radical SAM C-methyltransferase [Myxococcota bacterium]
MPTLELPAGHVCLVVPPLAHVTWPALGVHILQAVGRDAGHDVRVAYLNAALAQRIGLLDYASLANAPMDWLLGERLLGWRAWDDRDPQHAFDDLDVGESDVRSHNGGATAYLDQLSDGTGQRVEAWGRAYTREGLVAAALAAGAALDDLADAIVAAGYRVVGATTSYDQTAGAIALCRAVKERDPTITTLLGGANCEGLMADALADLAPWCDHVFSGESEAIFLDFLEQHATGTPLPRRLAGTPCLDLDALPAPKFDDYLAQIRDWIPDLLTEGQVWLSYESSRGCWWGEKQHCTFCGLNAMGMAYRAKSPEVVLRDLAELVATPETPFVAMADNILPYQYHKTVVPFLSDVAPNAHIFYEVKANMTLAQVMALSDGGIKVIQPGIESLSTPVLKRMRKGVFARQNLALLRYSAACGVMVKWNLLYAFPGDVADDYLPMLDLLPRLHHLIPPNGAVHLAIDRFSPYFDEAEAYGITDLKPLEAYRAVFPESADLHKLAYHFTGTWESSSKDDSAIRNQLWVRAENWHHAWSEDPPQCTVTPRGANHWVLFDSRGDAPITRILTDVQARAALVGGPWSRVPAAAWAVKHDLAVEMDGWCVPLAMASRDVLAAVEARWPASAQGSKAVTVLSGVRF